MLFATNEIDWPAAVVLVGLFAMIAVCVREFFRSQ